MLNHLRNSNPSLQIKSVFDTSFLNFGKIISGFDFSECIRIMDDKDIPEEGNTYVASDEDLMKTSVAEDLSNLFYGKMPIEIGYCNGNNSKLNALEYHKCSEIDVAVTDLVLILSDIRNIKNNQLSSTNTEIFYVPKNTAVELYSTTLHFSPCKVSNDGFKSIIVLAKGTNEALPSLLKPICDEDKLLWMQNKWLIAHSESVPASKGAYVGITGINTQIFY